MREDLYRGKRIDNGEWIYWNRFGRLTDTNGEPIRVEINTSALRPYAFYVNELPLIDEETVGQYTGLTDKNGTKIFEGDIIECDVFGAMVTVEHRKYLVAFENGAYVAQWSIGKHKFSTYMHETWGRNVVGNKWDNSELLEVMR